MIYTDLCIMFWMRAYPLLGEVEGVWALEFSIFLGPVKWERADRRVPFGAQIYIRVGFSTLDVHINTDDVTKIGILTKSQS